METHFNQPQRQSPIGILVLFFDTLFHYGKAFWPILVIWILKFNTINIWFFFLGIPSIIAIIGLISYLKYLNFTFYLDDKNDEFIINEGVFNKTKTTIQLHKIQQVNINQSFIQKIIGVYSLDVDTAGSASKEGKIRAISHPFAVALKSRLIDNEKRTTVLESDSLLTEPIVNEQHPFIAISFWSLIKVGITSNYVKSFSLLLLFFFTIADNFQKATGKDVLNDGEMENYFDKDFWLQSLLIGLFFLFVIVLIINLGRIIFKYFDYKITKQKGSLLLHFGLLNTKSTIIKSEKVQIISVCQNYFQKKMNILELKIKQATGGKKEERNATIAIPGCSKNEKDEILKLLFKEMPEKGVMLQPNIRKLGFALFITIGLPLFGFYIFRVYNPLQGEVINYLVPFYVVFVGLIQYFKYKNHRLFINEDCIILQNGAWDITNEIIKPNKIQAISTSQLFWHKSLNICSLTIHTAGGNLKLQLAEYSKIKEYINLWLYEMETSDSNWM